MDESLIVEVWDTFREYIPEKNREIAAHQYVDYLLGKDIEVAALEAVMGYDPHLDIAIKAVVDEESEYADEESDDYGPSEDEDY
jgi:DUF1680 family protein